MSLNQDASLSRVILADGTYDLVKAMILDHRIPPDTRVNIDDLARRLGVSQTPIREALARLESDSLVVKVPLKGYETTKLLTIEQFRDLFRFRAILEPWAAAEATVVADESELQALLAEVARGEELAVSQDADLPAFVEHDMRFHATVASMSHNSYVLDSLVRARVHMHLLRAHLASQNGGEGVIGGLFTEAYSGREGRSVIEHQAIAQAMAEGAPERARELMDRHIEGSLARLEASVARG